MLYFTFRTVSLTIMSFEVICAMKGYAICMSSEVKFSHKSNVMHQHIKQVQHSIKWFTDGSHWILLERHIRDEESVPRSPVARTKLMLGRNLNTGEN